MRVLVLGGTGEIGTAVVRALIRHGDIVCGLARSSTAEGVLTSLGASCTRGSLQVLDWELAVAESDAVIHCARDRTGDMATLNGRLMDWLLPQLGAKPLVCTGSCWVFGEGHLSEAMPFISNRTLGLDWLIHGCEAALKAAHGMVIHPGCVYSQDSAGRLTGQLERYSKEAEASEAVSVVQSAEVRSPWIDEDDLGELYFLVLHKGTAGFSYNASGFVDTNGNAARAAAKSIGREDVRIEALSAAEAHKQLPAVCAVGYSMDIPTFDTSRATGLGWAPKHTCFS
eukprot:gnl/TRDRNA2_/TRDRNA2_71571_c0_seq1.p1 gnl/TRDRNA2_/TRDRNA2_71571_c0~~gnl/TRDRNA2_/TRDRNA2_71571_c0_seq1.p1  ORF type:complete len:284 (+),score=43.19 gnl/TRDRNA2_/TRDRNA2_71571_c0_seq1:103-954(+)